MRGLKGNKVVKDVECGGYAEMKSLDQDSFES